MGSKKKQTVGYRYHMGLHFGLCHGSVDQVQQVKVGDRMAWQGKVTASQQISINAPELFGGDKREGGVAGALDVMMGEPTQAVNSYLASKIGAVIPAFRGILSAVFRGGLITSNNPYVKPWAFRVVRALKGWEGDAPWYSAKCAIGIGTGGTPEQVLPKSMMIAAKAWLRDTDKFDDFDIANTTEPTWESYFGEFGTDAVLSMVYYTDLTAPADSGVLPTKTLPLDRAREYLFHAYTYFDSNDIADCQLEFIDGSGNLIAAIVTQKGALSNGHYLKYGASLSSLTTVSSNTQTFLNISFSSSSIVATNLLGSAGNSGFSFICAATTITHVRISGVRVKSYYTGSVDPHATVYLRKAPKTIPAVEWEAFSMNGAHIIYECLTNTAWGMGYPTSAIDAASFTAAADTLYSESFGLCMVWNQQDSLQNFIRTVLDHIGGILYVQPDTGKFALTLIRDDYDRNTLPVLGPSNLISATDYQRQAWGETVNEVTVVYRDFSTNKDAAVTVQDLANIQTQGAVVSQTRQYPGLPNAILAQRVAMRDLNTVSTPLAKIRLTATRAAWKLIPGGVFRLTWPDYGIDDVVFRVLEVNGGTLQSGTITIEASEDVFGLPSNTYVGEQPGGWTEPASEPAAAPYRKMIEAPYWDIVRALSAAELAYLDSLSGYLQTLAVRPSGDSIAYEINAKVGAAAYEEKAIGEFCPSATLSAAIGKTTTAITFGNGVDIDLVTTGGYAYIGTEVVGITAINADAGTATITRGLLDTVPQDHANGARIWFADGFQGVDETEYASAETVDVKLLPRTGLGELALADAPADAITMAQRHYRPYPPGLFRISGQAYPAQLIDVALSATWAHRDRLQQTAYLVTQGEASIGPEAGTTYNVRLYDQETSELITQQTGISGTSWTGPALRGAYTLRLELESVRGGLVSWQAQSHVFTYLNDVRLTEGGDNRETEAGQIRAQE